MFLLINKYLVDEADWPKCILRTVRGSPSNASSGPVVMAGRQVPSIGGVVMIDVATRAEAEAFAAGDPYTSAGVASYSHRIQPGSVLPRPSPRDQGLMITARGLRSAFIG